MKSKQGWCHVIVAIAVLSAAAIAGCSTTPSARPEMEAISGTGMTSFQDDVSRNETLPPAGVVLNTKFGTTNWSGFMTGSGKSVTYVLRNPNPPESVFRAVYSFKNATIGNRHGGAVLELTGSSQGNVNVTPGTHSVWQMRLLSGTGDFEGATGHGLRIGKTYLGSTSTNYWFQVEVPKK